MKTSSFPILIFFDRLDNDNVSLLSAKRIACLCLLIWPHKQCDLSFVEILNNCDPNQRKLFEVFLFLFRGIVIYFPHGIACNSRRDRGKDEWMDGMKKTGWIDGWIGGWIGGWMEGRKNGRKKTSKQAGRKERKFIYKRIGKILPGSDLPTNVDILLYNSLVAYPTTDQTLKILQLCLL